jgi:polyhydroxyalkanoate synthesis regulator phasin
MNRHRLLLLAFLVSTPSTIAAQAAAPELSMLQIDALIARNDLLRNRANAGDFIVRHKVNGKDVMTTVTKAELQNLVIELVAFGELDPSDVPAFIKSVRHWSRVYLENDVYEEDQRLSGLRRQLAEKLGGDTLTRARAEDAYWRSRGTIYGKPIPVVPFESLTGAERYDALIAKADRALAQARAGDYLLTHEVNGKRVLVPVTITEFKEIIDELVAIGQLRPDEVGAFIGAAAIYTQNARAELQDAREGWTLKRDDLVRNGDRDGAEAETLARISAEVNAPSAGIAERTAERVRATVTGTRGASVMTPPVQVTPTLSRPPAADNSLASWMTGTFDSGGGLMTLTPSGGNYQYSNGRMRVTGINGAVMEGIWEQDSSGQKCRDGRHYGKFRLTFTANGFTGLFGYCEDEPSAPGGFQGTRRR